MYPTKLQTQLLVITAKTYFTSCFLSEEDITYSYTANGAAITNPPFSLSDSTLSVYTTSALNTGTFAMLLEAKIGTLGVD